MSCPSVTILKSGLSRIGGLEKYTWQIANAFLDKGARVTVLTTGSVVPYNPEIKVVSLPIERKLSYCTIRAFDRACRGYLEEKPSPVVFGLDRNRFQTHIRAGNGSHASYLLRRSGEEGWLKGFSFRVNPLHRLLLTIEKESFEHPELKVLFTNSHMVRKEILSQYNTLPEKVQVVHNGVEWSQMQCDFDNWTDQRSVIAKELALDSGCHQFLFIGHNYRRKGLDKLLKGLALLKEKNFQLSVIGKEKNLPFFRRLASQLGLKKQVHFFGPRQDIRRFYQLADTLTVPSLYDPFANVTVEALAMGLFVVSSSHNGGHEVLAPDTGVVVPSLIEPEAMANTLRLALEHPKTLARALNIRQSVRHLDFPNQLERIVQGCIK